MNSQAPWWQRRLRRVGWTRVGTWLFSHLLHRLDRLVVRLSNGRWSLTSLLTGVPVVVLTTTGAKTGKARTVPLLGFPAGEKIALIASNWGRERHPAWYHNLQANPEATLSIQGGPTGTYVAREATEEERERYWRAAVDLYPGYAVYEQRTERRRIPIVVLEPKGEGNGATMEPNEK